MLLLLLSRFGVIIKGMVVIITVKIRYSDMGLMLLKGAGFTHNSLSSILWLFSLFIEWIRR